VAGWLAIRSTTHQLALGVVEAQLVVGHEAVYPLVLGAEVLQRVGEDGGVICESQRGDMEAATGNGDAQAMVAASHWVGLQALV
jgi:hypothetical protein